MSDTDDFELPAQPEETTEKRNWPSAVGYEKVPDDWKPTLEKPLPALRCSHVRPDGTRCKKFGLRGTGMTATNGKSMCFAHGGSLPSVKKMAEAQVMAARMKLIENVDGAVDTLLELTQPGTADQVRLGAVKEILDRAGLKGAPDMTVEVEHTISYRDKIEKKLEEIRTKGLPKPEEDTVIGETVDDE